MLTHKQQRAYEAIRRFILEHGRSPTYTEIAVRLGLSVKSKGRAHELVAGLIDAGRLVKVHNKKWAVELVPDSNTVTLHLEPDMASVARQHSERAGVSVEAILIEALRDRLLFSKRPDFDTCEITASAAVPTSTHEVEGAPC